MLGFSCENIFDLLNLCILDTAERLCSRSCGCFHAFIPAVLSVALQHRAARQMAGGEGDRRGGEAGYISCGFCRNFDVL